MAKPKSLEIPFEAAENIALLRDRLPGSLWKEGEKPAEVVNIKIKHIWQFEKRITVLYEISFFIAPESTLQQQYVGYVVKSERLLPFYQKVVKNAQIVPGLGRAVTLIPDANLVLAAFPNDQKMKMLQKDDVLTWLQKNIKKINGMRAGGVDIIHGEVESLRYVPSKRYTMRCRFQLRNKENGADSEVSFIAKQFNDDVKARRLYRGLKSLEKAFNPHCSNNGSIENRFSYPVRIPKALGLFQPKPVVFVEEIFGNNLKESLHDIDLEKNIYHVGALLANFHKADKRVRKKITHRKEIMEVRDAFSLIKATLPQMRPQIRIFFTKFQQIDWQDDLPAVLLHGSYRLNHIFVHHDELALLDLDSMRMGHPAYDIANFLSSLYYLEAQERFPEDIRKTILAHFLRGYSEHTNFHIRPKAVLWFLASLLVNKQANKYVTHAQDDRENKVRLMLDLAQQILDKCDAVSERISLQQVGDVL